MVLSYIFVVGLVYAFILIPQKKDIEDYRMEQSRIEYDYMKMTGSPVFLSSIENAIKTATDKTRNFEWVDIEDVDASLTFYNYIYAVADKNNMLLVEISMEESRTRKKSKREQIYHIWKATFNGNFQNMVGMIENIENNEKFLIIEKIAINQGKGKNSDTFYDLIFMGIRKGAGYDKKTESGD